MKEPFNALRERGAKIHSAEMQLQLDRLLFSAVAAGLADEVTAALEGRADINARNDGGDTPLHHAIRTGRMNMAVLLIERGADVNLTDREGWTPLLLAAHKEFSGIVEELVGHKADLEAVTPEGATALIIAVKNRFEGIAVHLVRAGANPNARESDQDQPLLMMAIESCKEILMRDLVKHGADVTARNKDGVTALALAEKYGKTDLAQMIAERTHKRHVNKVKSAFMRRRRGGASPS